MQPRVDDVRIRAIHELVSPAELVHELPITPEAAAVVYSARQQIHRILHGADDRLLVVIGPCSIHDLAGARDYAVRLKAWPGA